MSERQIRKRAADILERAAQYIRRYGWQQEGMAEYGRPRCSMGAIDSACPRGQWDESIASLMYEELYQELDGLSLTQFNSKHRSGEKVAQLYERVAGKLLSV